VIQKAHGLLKPRNLGEIKTRKRGAGDFLKREIGNGNAYDDGGGDEGGGGEN
jgi:hypothetical protein